MALEIPVESAEFRDQGNDTSFRASRGLPPASYPK